MISKVLRASFLGRTILELSNFFFNNVKQLKHTREKDKASSAAVVRLKLSKCGVDAR